MNSIWIVESLWEVEGVYLPDNRDIQGVFSSEELVKESVIGQKKSEYDITEYEIDEHD